MRRVLFIGIAVLALVVPLVAASAGNGAPSGAHYNLNIIGVDKAKTADMDGSKRHTIFVPLVGSCKINLAEGDFQVLDGNCRRPRPRRVRPGASRPRRQRRV